jgi:hypothetical protein
VLGIAADRLAFVGFTYDERREQTGVSGIRPFPAAAGASHDWFRAPCGRFWIAAATHHERVDACHEDLTSPRRGAAPGDAALAGTSADRFCDDAVTRLQATGLVRRV